MDLLLAPFSAMLLSLESINEIFNNFAKNEKSTPDRLFLPYQRTDIGQQFISYDGIKLWDEGIKIRYLNFCQRRKNIFYLEFTICLNVSLSIMSSNLLMNQFLHLPSGSDSNVT